MRSTVHGNASNRIEIESVSACTRVECFSFVQIRLVFISSWQMNICRRFNMRKNDATSCVRRWGWLSRVAELVTGVLCLFEDKIRYTSFMVRLLIIRRIYSMHHFIRMEVPGVSAFWVWHSLEISCGRDATGGCCVEHQCRNRGSGKKGAHRAPRCFGQNQPDIFERGDRTFFTVHNWKTSMSWYTYTYW